MLEKLAAIEKRYDELTHLLELNAEDYQKVAELAKERSDLEPVISLSAKYHDQLKRQEQAHELENSEDEEMRELALAELGEVSQEIETTEKQLKMLLVSQLVRQDLIIFALLKSCELSKNFRFDHTLPLPKN